MRAGWIIAALLVGCGFTAEPEKGASIGFDAQQREETPDAAAARDTQPAPGPAQDAGGGEPNSDAGAPMRDAAPDGELDAGDADLEDAGDAGFGDAGPDAGDGALDGCVPDACPLADR